MGWFSRKKKEREQNDVIRIRLSGDESLDIENSFEQMGITSKEKQNEILENYTWHYLDDLDENLECTMQLVLTEVLEAARPFVDSRDLMEQLIGITYIRKEDDEDDSLDQNLVEVDFSDIRPHSISDCNNAGFKPANSLPTIKEIELRSKDEIAGRLHAIKSLVLWLMVPSEDLPDAKILHFIDQNNLRNFMTNDETNTFNSSRNDEELRNSIGWKFENSWPLAWYFGYDEPDLLGQMMTGEQMQEILINYTCPLDSTVEQWILKQEIASEESVLKKEDLFYCLHNAVRSAQLGRETVPNGFDPVGNGGVIHERRHSLTWMLSKGIGWEQTDLST